MNIKNYYLHVIFMLLLTGIFSYFVYRANYIPINLWLSDRNFREIVLVFLITSISTIFGIEYILTFQRNKEVIDNLRIIGIGYEIHVLYATLINFLIKHQLVELDKIGIIFHNYYKTKRNQMSKDDARKNFIKMTSEIINYFEDHIPNNEEIMSTNFSINEAGDLLDTYHEQLESYEKKFLFATKTNSSKLNRFSVIHELVKVNIHSLSRFSNDPKSDGKKFRVFLSTYRLLYGILEIIEYENEIFFFSERQYDEELTGKYYNKITQIHME